MSEVDIGGFYPKCFRVRRVDEGEREITITLKSKTRTAVCPECGSESGAYHGTYTRKVQDLPIPGKSVRLNITEYEYRCVNEDCGIVSFDETYDGFLSRYERMTMRCSALIRTIALETNCEGASRICREMGIKISGDAIIRMLRKLGETEVPFTGTTIGVDDFAYRKGHTYCTVICDGETRRPIEVLDGRDGEALKEWLLKNKSHIKAVTRDRAGAYAKAISEVLPEAMQVADRFHLHHNLLNAVKEALKSELPVRIEIPDNPLESPESETPNPQGEKNSRQVVDS